MINNLQSEIDRISNAMGEKPVSICRNETQELIYASIDAVKNKDYISDYEYKERIYVLNPTDSIAANNYATACIHIGEVQKAHDIFVSLLGKNVMAPSNYMMCCDYLNIPNDKRLDINKYFIPQNKIKFEPKKHDKIRLVYITSDAYMCAAGPLINQVISNHDRDKFEVYFLYNNDKYDWLSAQIFANSDKVFSIQTMSTQEVCNLIISLECDFLIDTQGHTNGGNCLNILAQHPCLATMTMIGYPNTTALDFIDYRVGSNICKGFTETLIDNPYGYTPLHFKYKSSKDSFKKDSFVCLSNIPKINKADLIQHDNWLDSWEAPLTIEYVRQGRQYTDSKTVLIKSILGSDAIVLNDTSSTYYDILSRYTGMVDTSTWSSHIVCMDALSAGCEVITMPSNDTCRSQLSREVYLQLGVNQFNNSKGIQYAIGKYTPIPWVRSYEYSLVELYRELWGKRLKVLPDHY